MKGERKKKERKSKKKTKKLALLPEVKVRKLSGGLPYIKQEITLKSDPELEVQNMAVPMGAVSRKAAEVPGCGTGGLQWPSLYPRSHK